MNETKMGGLLLFSGASILLVTIFFEYRLGWIGMERPSAEIPPFIYNNWDKLRLIWGWQAFSHLLFTVSYILFLKRSKGITSLLWALLFICGILLVISMGITLGSYYPSLKVYESQPEIFESIRGAIKTLYFPSQLGSVTLIIIFCLEIFRKEGVINKRFGLLILVVVVLSIIIGLITSISVKVTGAVWFILPLVLGISYWRNNYTS